MESFFLAETLKYLYLIFDTENFLHNDLSSNSFKIVKNRKGECTIGTGFYIFNTEAHPIDGACLECCRTLNRKNSTAASTKSDLNRKLVDRYANLRLRNQLASSQELYNENRFSLKSFDEEFDDLRHELDRDEQRSDEKFKEYCFHTANLNDTQAQSFKLIDDDQEALLFGHFYPFRCSLNNTFKLRVNNLYTQSYFP